jgi:hypothetical protein
MRLPLYPRAASMVVFRGTERKSHLGRVLLAYHPKRTFAVNSPLREWGVCYSSQMSQLFIATGALLILSLQNQWLQSTEDRKSGELVSNGRDLPQNNSVSGAFDRRLANLNGRPCRLDFLTDRRRLLKPNLCWWHASCGLGLLHSK